jgi:nicotinamide riboside kinase
MKVALIGSHGVGKTTLVYELAARLKRLDVNVELVSEVARRCPLPINETTTRDAQEWILATQMAQEIAAHQGQAVALCDRSLLDNYCYLVAAAGPVPMWEAVLDDWMTGYRLLVAVPVSEPPTFDGVRAASPGFQQRIERLIEEMIAARGLKPLRLDPDHRDAWPDVIMEALLPLIDPTRPLFSHDEL